MNGGMHEDMIEPPSSTMFNRDPAKTFIPFNLDFSMMKSCAGLKAMISRRLSEGSMDE